MCLRLFFVLFIITEWTETVPVSHITKLINSEKSMFHIYENSSEVNESSKASETSTFFTLLFQISSQKSVDFWDETEPFGLAGKPSPDLRLPTEITPSFYRLKLKADLDNSNFTGEIAITLRASKQTKQIILHSKDLIINPSAKLTEQIYEKLALHRSKRDTDAVPSNSTDSLANATVTETTVAPETTATATNITSTKKPTVIEPVETQVTHSAARSIKILKIKQSTGDRLIIVLDSTLKTNVDYILELGFEGKIKESLNGFYKSSYKTKDGVEK